MRQASFGRRLEAVFSSWEETKLFIEHSMGISTESLHIFGGVAILLFAAVVLRRPLSHSAPWLVVLVFAIVNELADLTAHRWPRPGAQFGESVKDIFVTMVLPTLLLFTTRKTPRLYGSAAPAPRGERSVPDISGPG